MDFARQPEGKESIRRAKGGQGGKHGKNVRAVGQTLYRWVPHPAAHGQVLFVMSGPCLLRHDPRRVHPGKDCGRMAHHLPHTAEAAKHMRMCTLPPTMMSSCAGVHACVPHGGATWRRHRDVFDPLSSCHARVLTRPFSRDHRYIDVIDPSNETVWGRSASGSEEDVNAAVAAAKRAEGSWAKTTGTERAKILRAIADAVGPD